MMSEALTVKEQRLLERCEQTIDAGLDVFVKVGRALLTIKSQKLYRAEYETFEEYCKVRWDLSRQHAYRKIDGAIVVGQVSPAPVLPNERQARELKKYVTERNRRDVWLQIVSAAEGQRVTLRHVNSVIHGLSSGIKPRNYGEPIDFRGLRHAPINEQGVVFLFGMVSDELGFLVESVHHPFPDCTGKREYSKRGQRVWRDVKIEFEFKSRNYKAHKHTNDCHVIVCWEHNWRDCPI